MGPFRWVKHSPIFGSNLAPIIRTNAVQLPSADFEMGLSVGWNSLLIGAESCFGLQGWIGTLGLKQIFLIFSVVINCSGKWRWKYKNCAITSIIPQGEEAVDDLLKYSCLLMGFIMQWSYVKPETHKRLKRVTPMCWLYPMLVNIHLEFAGTISGTRRKDNWPIKGRKRRDVILLHLPLQRKRHLKKVNARSFKLYRAFPISFSSSNVSSFLELNCKDSSEVQNEKLGTFKSKSYSDGKEMYQKAWCTCKVFFAPVAFLEAAARVSKYNT